MSLINVNQAKRKRFPYFRIHILLKKQNYKCNICKRCIKDGYFHKDHIVPLFNGGLDDISNIQLIDAHCHYIKTKKEMKEYWADKRSYAKGISPYFDPNNPKYIGTYKYVKKMSKKAKTDLIGHQKLYNEYYKKKHGHKTQL